jgi:hypothetical protein
MQRVAAALIHLCRDRIPGLRNADVAAQRSESDWEVVFEA